MQNRNRYRDPFQKNPMERTNPFEMRIPRPVRRPAPRRQQPRDDMGDIVKTVGTVATVGILAGTTIGIMGALQPK